MYRFYSRSGLCIHLASEIATIGISSHFEDLLGQILYVNLPRERSLVSRRQVICDLETYHSAISIASPLSGRIVSINKSLIDEPEFINVCSEAGGWLFKMGDLDHREFQSLMSPAKYDEFRKRFE